LQNWASNWSFSPLERTLAHLCRITPAQPNECDIISEQTQVIDSINDLATCSLHSTLAPLLLWNLLHPKNITDNMADLLLKRLSPELRTELRKAHRYNWIKSFMREQAVAQIATQARDLNLSLVLYKGMAYNRQFYPEVSLRPMLDIDLLIHPDQLIRTSQLLTKLGYRQDPYKHVYERIWSHPKTNVYIDLHFGVHWPYQARICIDELLAERYPAGDLGYILPAPKQFLLHILHQSKHSYLPPLVPLISFVETRELFIQVHHQWELVKDLAQRWHLQHVLQYGVSFLRDLYPGLVPEHYAPASPPFTQLATLLKPLLRHHLPLPDSLRYQFYRSIFHLFHISLIDSNTDCCAYIATRIMRKIL
jgi:hypothetical protein